MKELILLDSDSSATITRNKKHASNARGTTDTMHAETNGCVTTAKKSCIPNVGEHWLSEKSLPTCCLQVSLLKNIESCWMMTRRKLLGSIFLEK